jgi:predicted Ser/Thr protein kinase
MSSELQSDLQKNYRTLIGEKKLQDVKQLMERTHTDPLEYLVQIGYRTYLDEDVPDRVKLFYFLKLYDITAVMPENVTLRRICEIALHLDSLLMIETLIKRLHLEPALFKEIQAPVHKAFRDLLHVGQFNQIARLMTLTGITPSEDIIQRAYRTYLLEGRFISLMGLREHTGINPDKKVTSEVLKWYFANYTMLRQLNFADIESQRRVSDESTTWLEWIEELSKISGLKLCFRCGQQNRDSAQTCSNCRASFSGEPQLGRIETPPPMHTQLIEKPLIGHTILKERFRILRLLGRGGMGEIYLAEDARLQRKVAIKSIIAQYIQDQSAHGHLLREAQLASRLDHPNICTIFEIIEEEGNEYIVMQFIDGVTLDKHIKDVALDRHAAVEIGLQIADGIMAAHEQGILHRDLKLANIMLDRNGRIKILDFGLAKTMEPATAPLPNPGGFVYGTPAYMSPEQILGLDVDMRSDIFSFGVILYELVAHKNPFVGRDQGATLFNVLHNEPAFAGIAPDELAALLQRALHKDRAMRYESFRELYAELLKIQPLV